MVWSAYSRGFFLAVFVLLVSCGGRSTQLHGGPLDSGIPDAPATEAGPPDRGRPDSHRPDTGLPAPDLGPPKSTWAFAAGGPGSDSIRAMAVDSQRAVYITGAFDGSATFGKTTLKSAGSHDLYLARIGPDGELLWALRGGGTGYDMGLDVAVGPGGDVYLGGEFNLTAKLGGKTFTSKGSSDVLLARVSPAGQVRWVATGGGAGLDRGITVAVDDKTGVAFLAGTLTASANFGVHKVSPKGALQNAFLAGVTPTGAFSWVSAAVSDTWSSAAEVALAPGGWIYLGGSFGDQVDLGGTVLKGKATSTGYLAAFDRQGKGRWAGAVSGAAVVDVISLDLDSAGAVYATGTTSGGVIFGKLKEPGPPYTPVRHAFVLKSDAKGQGKWILTHDSTSPAFGDALAVRFAPAFTAGTQPTVLALGKCSAAYHLGGRKVCTLRGRYLVNLSTSGHVGASASSLEWFGSLLEVDDHGGIYLARSDIVGMPVTFEGKKLPVFGKEDVLVWKWQR